MATSSIESASIRYINEIKDYTTKKEFALMTEKVTSLTKILFSNKDLIYSSINQEFEKSGVCQLLVESMILLNEQSKRDILRLLNIFMKTNYELRNKMANNTIFVQYLLQKLENRDIWNSVDKMKYCVNIASHLLLNREAHSLYETNSIRGIVRQILTQSKSNHNDPKRVLCLVFYSSAAIDGNLDSIEGYDNDYNLVLCKEIRNWFIDIIRDYLIDFKSFYDSSISGKNTYYKYCYEVGYSFDQILNCIFFFSHFNKILREDIFQSGIYELLSSIFLIKNVPEIFILYAIDVFTIPAIDESIKERFRSEHSSIIDKLKAFQSSESLAVKSAIDKLLKNYVTIKTDMLFTLPQPSSSCFSPGYAVWGSLDVENWLIENNLVSCSQKFKSLTGKGLNQLKLLMNENNGKFQLIELLMSKMNLDLVTILELMGALQSYEGN